jgi:16S rRNA processing protein RimM
MERIAIGKTGKPHGIKGELKLWVEAAYETDLLEASAVFIGGRPFFIEQLRTGAGLILKLEGVDNRDAAQLLANRQLELRAEDIAEPEEEAASDPLLDLVGFELYDSERGRIGVIEDVLDMPQQYLAVVEYQQKEVLVPLHEDLIRGIDPATGRITLQLPEGLLDL